MILADVAAQHAELTVSGWIVMVGCLAGVCTLVIFCYSQIKFFVSFLHGKGSRT